jgi:hypothetical protein
MRLATLTASPPDIVLKFLVADNPGDDGAGIDPDSKEGVAAILFLLLVQECLHLNC